MHAPLGTPPDGPQELFVSSRYVPQIATMVPFLSGNQNSTTWNCAPASDVVLLGGSDSLSSGLVGSEMRGVAIIDPPDSRRISRNARSRCNGSRPTSSATTSTGICPGR